MKNIRFGKILAVTMAMSMVFLVSAANKSSADDILGMWLTEGGKSKVKVFKRGNQYFGKVTWLKEPYEADGKTLKVDDENSDENLQKRRIVGIEVLKNLVWDADDDEWDDGEIYDPESGNDYSLYCEMEGERLRLRGYMGISLLGRTSYWTRTK